MRKAGFQEYKTDEEGNTYYLVDRNQVSFRAKSNKKRVMSEEQRKAAAKRLANARKNKNKKESE
ncbi:hypothetical protein F4V43_02075 [Paenibacillus spiritus]|uniref:Uncharacterized protein n=1 Tax=Paenibacillus spiritus TaxID=2496557 RepID=A0A5J5GGG2_9BACL|nr:hypothetical protein [Paenibacillus spiritus]KAA9007296.1 hypothetical protein F4V43_02075 [Paenibacillus spiritus]